MARARTRRCAPPSKKGWKYGMWIGDTDNGFPVGIIFAVVVIAVLVATGVI